MKHCLEVRRLPMRQRLPCRNPASILICDQQIKMVICGVTKTFILTATNCRTYLW
jgi:hypothetical protein